MKRKEPEKGANKVLNEPEKGTKLPWNASQNQFCGGGGDKESWGENKLSTNGKEAGRADMNQNMTVERVKRKEPEKGAKVCKYCQEGPDCVDNYNEEEDEGGESENSSDSGNKKDVTVEIEAQALDCPVCFEPLSLPLFQCTCGHVLCSNCCNELKQRCPFCTLPVTPFRCLFLERIIESNKISCPYARFGCQEPIAYNLKNTHKDSCSYAPCFCPIPACMFKGSITLLSSHLKKEHISFVPQKDFDYGHSFKVSLHKQQLFYILHGTDDLVFLLISSFVASSGNHLSVACIRPNKVTTDIRIELEVTGKNESSLCLKGLIENIRKWEEDYQTKLFINVPEWISTASSDGIEVDVCIRKI